jgi:hypothetical protein
MRLHGALIALMMEAERASETSVGSNKTTRYIHHSDDGGSTHLLNIGPLY